MKDFKPIEGFKGYLVSPTGKVYSLKSNKYLSLSIVGRGYYRIILYNNGKIRYKLVARLVAQAFIPNPYNKPQVNHKDGDKSNNNKSNLEWVTCSENQLHAFATGLNKKSHKSGKPKIPVNVYDYSTGKFLSTHSSMNDAARRYRLSIGNIYNVLNGIYRKTGGLTFTKL